MNITYRSQTESLKITEPFDFSFSFSTLNYSSMLGMIDSHELDKSYEAQIEIRPAYVLKFKQEVYTYILRCIDLNFGYTDYLQDLFNFKNEEEYFRSTDQLLKARALIKT